MFIFQEDGFLYYRESNVYHCQLCLLSAVNKPVMLKCGLIDAVLPYIKVDLAAVQFKLLGTLRMIIDGQGEAMTASGCHH